MFKKWILAFTTTAVLLTGLFFWSMSARTGASQANILTLIPEAKAMVVASSTCGCCKLYAQYLKQFGFDVNFQAKTQEEVNDYKKASKIPDSLLSCHTTQIGQYLIEGHIPMEVIEKLLKEKPDVKGIGMAGMPSGSPGMPGPKAGPFVIDTIAYDGQNSGLFMEY